MTIAKVVTGAIGARAYLPEGPFGTSGNFPLPAFGPGDVLIGDYGAEYEYALHNVTTTYTANQGDAYVIDNNGYAVQTYATNNYHALGSRVATFFLGGQVGINSAPVNGSIWSYTFPTVGVYGIWLQRAGTTLVKYNSINAQAKPLITYTTLGMLDAPSSLTVGSQTLTGAWTAKQTQTFTASAASGATTLTSVTPTTAGNSLPFITKGITLSGTSIPNGTYVTDIQGSTITISQATTGLISAGTITASMISSYCTTTSGSPLLTNVTSIVGLYPNQTVTGTGVGASGSGTILSITGNAPGQYVITINSNSTATANSINIVPSVYAEAYFEWPYIGTNN